LLLRVTLRSCSCPDSSGNLLNRLKCK
jgi:hypothetical protein